MYALTGTLQTCGDEREFAAEAVEKGGDEAGVPMSVGMPAKGDSLAFDGARWASERHLYRTVGAQRADGDSPFALGGPRGSDRQLGNRIGV